MNHRLFLMNRVEKLMAANWLSVVRYFVAGVLISLGYTATVVIVVEWN